MLSFDRLNASQAVPAFAPPACQRCGACCFSPSETYVRVTGEDWARLGPDAEGLVHFVGNRAYLRMIGGRCAALAVRPDPESGGLGFSCTIYERRPQVCRDLERGSPACEAEILRKTAAATLALPGAPL